MHWDGVRWHFVMPKTAFESMNSIATNLEVLGMRERLELFSQAKSAAGLAVDAPRFLEPSLDKASEAAEFLRHAEKFKSLADEDTELGIAPILYYYSATFLNSFFSEMLFDYGKPTGHGITMAWGNSLDQTGVKVQTKGQFIRLVDSYVLLDIDHYLSQFDAEGGSQGPGLPQVIMLKDFEKIRLENQNLAIRDKLDYLLLFLSSSVARYRPKLWSEILRAEKYDVLPEFAGAFERFGKYLERVVCTIFQISQSGVSGGYLRKEGVYDRTKIDFSDSYPLWRVYEPGEDQEPTHLYLKRLRKASAE